MSDLQKVKRWRSKKYTAWVKKLSCYISRVPACGDAHHIIAEGMSGMALTAPDWSAMPLTRGKHTQMHEDPELQKRQWPGAANTLLLGFKNGAFVVKPGKEEEFTKAIGALLDNGQLVIKK